jgi:hypothetical protein
LTDWSVDNSELEEGDVGRLDRATLPPTELAAAKRVIVLADATAHLSAASRWPIFVSRETGPRCET